MSFVTDNVREIAILVLRCQGLFGAAFQHQVK